VDDVHGRLLELPAALSAARTASVARPTLASAPLTNWSSRAAVPSAAGFSSHVRSGAASSRVQVEVDPELRIEFGDLKDRYPVGSADLPLASIPAVASERRCPDGPE